MFPPRLTTAVLAALLCVALAPWPAAASPIEDYAPYQPAKHCSHGSKPGTEVLAAWIVAKYGGGLGPIWRACDGSTSEHHEGRAAHLRARLFAADAEGNQHALARRMGVMYVIWDDRMWSAWDGFTKSRYRPCPRRKCSATLRHRDHLHLSLTRAGGRGATSWYDGRIE